MFDCDDRCRRRNSQFASLGFCVPSRAGTNHHVISRMGRSAYIVKVPVEGLFVGHAVVDRIGIGIGIG